MNSYLYKRLNEVNSKVAKIREFKSLKDKLISKLATVTSEFDEAKKSFDVQDAKELIDLINEVDKDYNVLFDAEEFTLVIQEKNVPEEDKFSECAECEIPQEPVEEKQEEKVEEPRVESEQQEMVEQVEQTTTESKEEVEEKIEPAIKDQQLSLASLFKTNSPTE